MSYLQLFEGKTPFSKVWLLLDLRGELDLRLTKILVLVYNLIIILDKTIYSNIVPVTIVLASSFPPPSLKNEYMTSVWSPKIATTLEMDSTLEIIQFKEQNFWVQKGSK